MSNDYAFAKDAATLRVKARVAAGIPAPAKSIRKLTITAPGGATASTGQSQSRVVALGSKPPRWQAIRRESMVVVGSPRSRPSSR